MSDLTPIKGASTTPSNGHRKHPDDWTIDDELAYLHEDLTKAVAEDDVEEILAISEFIGYAQRRKRKAEKLQELRDGAKSGKWVHQRIPPPDEVKRLDGQQFLIGRMRPWTFHKMPKWLAAIPNERLTLGAKMVYAYLHTLAGKDGCALVKPKQGSIGTAIGMSERQVRRYIEELVYFGLLKSETRRAQSNIYMLVPPKFPEGADLEDY